MDVATAAGDMDDPGAPGWAEAAREAITLSPVPLDAQPNDYIRAAGSEAAYGTVGEVDLAVAWQGDQLLVRLEWDDLEGPSTEFPDAAAVLFPSSDDAPVEQMGSPDHPVQMWLWQSGRPAGRQVTARGPGVFQPIPGADRVATAASLGDGRWSVVFSGPVGTVGDVGKLGVVVWNGANEERAGFGSVTTGWIPVAIENRSGGVR